MGIVVALLVYVFIFLYFVKTSLKGKFIIIILVMVSFLLPSFASEEDTIYALSFFGFILRACIACAYVVGQRMPAVSR